MSQNDDQPSTSQSNFGSSILGSTTVCDVCLVPSDPVLLGSTLGVALRKLVATTLIFAHYSFIVSVTSASTDSNSSTLSNSTKAFNTPCCSVSNCSTNHLNDKK